MYCQILIGKFAGNFFLKPMPWYRQAFAALTLTFIFIALLLTFWPELLRLLPPAKLSPQKNSYKQQLLQRAQQIAKRITF